MRALNAALFVALAGGRELHVYRQAAAENGKFGIHLARATAQHLDNGRRGIIEDAVTRYATELNARAQHPIKECQLIFGSIAVPKPRRRIA